MGFSVSFLGWSEDHYVPGDAWPGFLEEDAELPALLHAELRPERGDRWTHAILTGELRLEDPEDPPWRLYQAVMVDRAQRVGFRDVHPRDVRLLVGCENVRAHVVTRVANRVGLSTVGLGAWLAPCVVEDGPAWAVETAPSEKPTVRRVFTEDGRAGSLRVEDLVRDQDVDRVLHRIVRQLAADFRACVTYGDTGT